MTARRFEFKEGTSNKFWEVELTDTRVTTRYGKLGTDGQTTLKDSPNAAAAQKVYDGLIKEKTRKGYVEVTAAAGSAATKSKAKAKAAPKAAPVTEPKAEPTQSDAELLDLAMRITDGQVNLKQVTGRARQLIGDGTDRFVAASRLFATVPSGTKHSTLGRVEVDGRRVAAAYFSGDEKTARSILSSYRKLTEFQAHWLYDTLLNGGDSGDVFDCAKFALTVHPQLARALKMLAVQAIDAGRPREAVPFLETALEANPTYASGWYNLACAWSKAGEKQQMLAALQEAITHGKATTMSDYRKTALGDLDFKAWLKDADFIALVRPMAATPGAEGIDQRYDRDDFDGALTEAARLMAEHPEHAKAYAKLARRTTKTVVGDLEEHGDANADDYGLGGVKEYQALEAALKAVEAKGDAASIAAFTRLLPAPAKKAKKKR